MKRVSRFERRASEHDTRDLPISEVILDWRHFNQDMYSSDLSCDQIRDIAELNLSQRVDLRPYMIENPQVCFTTDKLPKVLNMFRFNNMRQICVLGPTSGRLLGVIGRLHPPLDRKHPVIAVELGALDLLCARRHLGVDARLALCFASIGNRACMRGRHRELGGHTY